MLKAFGQRGHNQKPQKLDEIMTLNKKQSLNLYEKLSKIDVNSAGSLENRPVEK